jgi:hypothetical protein
MYSPKITFIIPVYNAAQYLHECLDSIVEINCCNLFGSKTPEFARLPNITFHPNKMIIEHICQIFECKLAIWEMEPRYNMSGELDAFEENLSLSDIWNEWKNFYNQNYIYDCCSINCGVFESNHAIVIPQNVPLSEMNRYLYILQLEEQQYFKEIAKVTETCGMLLTYLYERQLFLLLTSHVFAKEVKNILEIMHKYNTIHGTVSIKTNLEITGQGLFNDEWENTIQRIKDNNYAEATLKST